MSFSAHVQGADNDHPNVHLQHQKVFSCSQCLKSFSRSENLKRHIASHEAGKYRCIVCGKHFTRSDLLKRHRKNHEKRINFSAEARPDHLQPLVSTENEESSSGNLSPIPGSSEGIDGHGQPDSMQEGQSGIPFDTFMSSDDISGLNLGSFDGDIGWTLDFAYSHPFMDAFPGEYLTPSSAGFTDVDSGKVMDIADDETGDWPDRISRPASPKGQRHAKPRRNPVDWSAMAAESLLANAQRQPGNTFAMSIDQGMREVLVNLLSLPPSQPSDGSLHVDSFPATEILDHFLLLYFRHIHERFPVIHLPTFHLSKISPFLLMAMLLAGSSHSKTNKGWFVKVFYKHCQVALMRNVEANNRFVSMR